jgi:hypothetical protein
VGESARKGPPGKSEKITKEIKVNREKHGLCFGSPRRGSARNNRTGGAIAKTCAYLKPANSPCTIQVGEILAVGPSPRGLAHFVAAALPNIPIRAHKLGDRISLTGVAHRPFKGLRCGRSFSAVVPLVRSGTTFLTRAVLIVCKARPRHPYSII